MGSAETGRERHDISGSSLMEATINTIVTKPRLASITGIIVAAAHEEHHRRRHGKRENMSPRSSFWPP